MVPQGSLAPQFVLPIQTAEIPTQPSRGVVRQPYTLAVSQAVGGGSSSAGNASSTTATGALAPVGGCCCGK